MKKITVVFSIILALCLTLPCFAYVVVQEDSGPTFYMTAFGDSLASGYSLDDYGTVPAKTLDAKGDPAMHSPSAAPYLLAKRIGYEYLDYTKEGTSATGRLSLMNTIGETVDQYKFNPETKKFECVATVENPNKELLADAAKSDIIVLSIGNFDMMGVYAFTGSVSNPSATTEEKIQELYELLTTIVDDINALTDRISAGVRECIARIQEINPDADIVIQNQYNSYENVEADVLGLKIKEVVRLVTLNANMKLAAVAKELGVYVADLYTPFALNASKDILIMKCDNIEDYLADNYERDPHPTALGHQIMAEAYYNTLVVNKLLPTYIGNDLPSEKSYTMSEAATITLSMNMSGSFITPKLAGLPSTVTLKTTKGDYEVEIDSWDFSNMKKTTLGFLEVFTPLPQTFIATARLKDVPGFIHNLGEVGIVVTVDSGSPRKAGDANGDGVVNGMDIIKIKKYLACNSTPIIFNNANVVPDKTINVLDLVVVLIMNKVASGTFLQ